MLIRATLETALEELAVHPGATIGECANKWASAVANYFASILPASTTVLASQSALASSLAAAFAKPTDGEVATAMEDAFKLYATAVAGGMLGAGFTGAPPPAIVGFALLAVPPFVETHSAAAEKYAAAIEAWAWTGTAAPLTTGPIINWS